ncbi:tyrosine-type recombinase/integrase [Stenotrophomonas sp. NPDC077659]|uniref:tyrosine-type recombinase/integrase n=1 Tax=Stenotrophomonas sp. NPDC077659 TaxID=3390694 RepID=UPI003CFCDE5B
MFIARSGHRPIDTLRPMEMESYRTDRLTKDKVAPETVGKEVRRLQAAFRRGVKWKKPDFNPLEETKAPRGVRSVAVRFYGRLAMRKLYHANPDRARCGCSWPTQDYAEESWLGFARNRWPGAGSGWKASQTREDGQGRTKSGKWREVPLNRYVRWALRRLPDPLVAVHKDTASDWFASDAKRAGIGGSLHRLRHTFCEHMVMAGVPLRRVQILASHADYVTTEKYYAHLTPEGDDGDVAKLRYRSAPLGPLGPNPVDMREQVRNALDCPCLSY